MPDRKLPLEDRIALRSAWLRWVIGVIVAIAVAVMIATYIQRDNLIAGCLRNSDSRLIDAQFYESAATKNESVARSTSDDNERIANLKAAGEYRVLAVAKRKLIPMPSGKRVDPNTRGDNHGDVTAGCHDAYPAPIPGVE